MRNIFPEILSGSTVILVSEFLKEMEAYKYTNQNSRLNFNPGLVLTQP